MVQTYLQQTSSPTSKVQAVGYTGLAITAIIFVGSLFGIQVPEDMATQAVVGASALVTLGTFVAGYFKKSKVAELAPKVIPNNI